MTRAKQLRHLLYKKIKAGSEVASPQTIERTFKPLSALDAYAHDFKGQAECPSYEAEARWQQIILFGAVITHFCFLHRLFGLSVLS